MTTLVMAASVMTALVMTTSVMTTLVMAASVMTAFVKMDERVKILTSDGCIGVALGSYARI